MKALNQNELSGLIFNPCVENSGPCYQTGDQALSLFALDNPKGVWICIGINLMFAFIYNGFGYILFRVTSKPLLRLQ